MTIFLISLIFLSLGAFLGRAAGGGFGAHRLDFELFASEAFDVAVAGRRWTMPALRYKPTNAPEIAFAALLAVPVFWHFGGWAGLVALAWFWGWMETGHGVAYHMGRHPQEALKIDPKTGKRRTQTLSPVLALCEALFGLKLGSRAWCWVFMGLKGLLIGLPLFPFGLALAILWPAAYEAGYLLKDKFPSVQPNVVGEVAGPAVAAALAGLALFAWGVA